MFCRRWRLWVVVVLRSASWQTVGHSGSLSSVLSTQEGQRSAPHILEPCSLSLRHCLLPRETKMRVSLNCVLRWFMIKYMYIKIILISCYYFGHMECGQPQWWLLAKDLDAELNVQRCFISDWTTTGLQDQHKCCLNRPFSTCTDFIYHLFALNIKISWFRGDQFKRKSNGPAQKSLVADQRISGW